MYKSFYLERIAILFLVIAFSVVVSGCSRRATAVATIVNVPPINTINSAELGNSMVDKVYAIFPYKNNAILERKKDQEDFRTKSSGNRFGSWRGHDCVLHHGSRTLIDKDCNGKFDHDNKGNPLIREIPYYLVQNTEPSSLLRDSIRQELIYQGRTGNKIKMQYREFVNIENRFIIRDGFSQYIEYELDDNGKAFIGFKGLRIEVFSATNNDIRYKLIRGFD